MQVADISMREVLIEKINTLTDEQVAALYGVVANMQQEGRTDYDPNNDPAIGFLKDAPPDYSERAKEILREEVDSRSGWTQKDKLP